MFNRGCAHNNAASPRRLRRKGAARKTLLFFFAFLFAMLSPGIPALRASAEPSSPAATSSQPAEAHDPRTLSAGSAYPKSTIQIIINVSVNTVAKGDFFAELDEDGHILLAVQDIDALKLSYSRDKIVLIREERYVLLSALPETQYTFDDKKLTLAFIGKTTETSKASVDVFSVQTRPHDIYYPRETSLFLNYGLTYSRTDTDGFQTFTASNKLGARTGDIFFVSDSLYTKTRDDDNFVRLQSSAAYERRGDLQWLVLGDRFASSGELGSSVNMGGITFSKVYKLDPYFITQPVFNIQGVTMFPSQAEIYLDGTLVSKQSIAPGVFELNNLYSFSGSHDIVLVLRDPFGNEQRISYPVYFDTFMLRKGLHEYNYSAGFLREQYGTESNDYGKPVFSAFHRYGVTNSLNIGGRAEGSSGISNGGITASFLSARTGAFTVSLAGSEANGAKGSAGSFQHSYQLGNFNTNLLLRGFSGDYATIAVQPDSESDSTKYEMTMGAGLSMMPIGGFSISYSKTGTHAGVDTRIASLNYTRGLTGTANLFANASRTEQSASDTTYSFFAGLNFSFGKNTRGSLLHNTTDGTDTETLQLQKDVPVGEGLGWRAAMTRTDAGASTTNSFNPFVQYNGRYGIYSVESAIQSASGTTAETHNLSVAGSLVYAGGFFGASRPVSDSFGIVMVEGVPNVGVLNNGQEIGKTNSSGMLVLPMLTSYGQNRISLDVKNIPMDYSISGVNRSISPSLWSGSCVAFDAVKTRAVTGRLLVMKDSVKKPVEFQEGTLTTDARMVTFPTGKGGEFYIENVFSKEPSEGEDRLSCGAIRRATGGMAIRPGQYSASIDYDGRPYLCLVAFPETEYVITDLGEIQCELQGKVVAAPEAKVRNSATGSAL